MARCFIFAVLFALVTQVVIADDPPKDPKGAEFFTTKVEPLLSANCYRCHGAEKQERNLRLDTYDGLMKGGDSGNLIVSGKPDESLLLIAVSYKNEDLQMPPDAKLPDEEIDIFRKWIQSGMPHPSAKNAPNSAAPAGLSGDKSAASSFWAFRPPAAAPLPVVQNEPWPRTPIDRFILASLEARKLAPASGADKRTLIRRATFDLTGLPPTPAEMEQFLNDNSPEAFTRVVDRLLASPQYGERWGRHWLDVARYADSNGSDENVAHGNAWRYRDYVIAAYNADKPFDQFVREQIAGDLLPADNDTVRHERLVATGFLSLGAKVLAEVDERKMEMDIVDEQLDTLCRTLLGLTMGCARCHDHKFDPIRTADYYALAGILRSTRTMENFTKVARWNENVLASPAERAAREEYDKKIEAHKADIKKVVDEANAALLATLGADARLPKDAEKKYPDATQTQLKSMRDELARIEKGAPPLASAMGVSEGKIADTAICIRGSHLTLGQTVPRGVPAVLATVPVSFSADQSGRRELAEWFVDRRNPLTARVIVNRIWRWHFGRGIVESPDNFGQLGDRPSNPPLLDWLAIWFMDNNWSIKSLHRLILTSATYQQASALAGSLPPSEIANRQSLDPENRLLHRFPVQRLDAEVIRDALLAVSGQLDLAQGGSLLHIGNREYFFDHTSKDNTRYDAQKRSVYLPVVRNNLYEMFQLFDATDATVSNGDRATSTVATQALFMLNSPLMVQSSQALAQRVLTFSEDDARRLQGAYELCFSRPATTEEIERARLFLDEFESSLRERGATANDARLEAWTALCHVMLASNEFIYVQ